MIKVIELIIVATLLIFSFFAGVKYSDSVRNHASWLFEPKEEEIELPDLSQESLQDAGEPMDGADVPAAIDNSTAAPNSEPVETPVAPKTN